MLRFQRPLGERRYKKLFIIAVEGSKTEPQYFDIFNELQSMVLVKCLKGKLTNSAPVQVLKRIKSYLGEESLEKTDEAWIVVDKDDWTEDQLQELLQWEKKSSNYGVALSNPNFEYWLLLHFEDGKGIANSRECRIRLKKHLPNYDKDIDSKKFKLEFINQAVKRAKQRDIHRFNNLSEIGSTVYRLVERILNHKS